MHTCIDLGRVPRLEHGALHACFGFAVEARRECQALIGQLRRTVGHEPSSASLAVIIVAEDAGLTPRVGCYFDPSDEIATQYAVRCATAYPDYWSIQARKELAS